MHINKFAKKTIISYHKNNPILTSKCTKESLQVNLNFNFIKYMFMWRSSITSSIYRFLMPLAHKHIHQHKRKNKRRNLVRNLMLTCSNVYTYLSHFLLTFTNTKERTWEEIGQWIWYLLVQMFILIFLIFSYPFIIIIIIIISRLHTNISSSSFFLFFVNMSIQSIYFSFIYYISLCISI